MRIEALLDYVACGYKNDLKMNGVQEMPINRIDVGLCPAVHKHYGDNFFTWLADVDWRSSEQNKRLLCSSKNTNSITVRVLLTEAQWKLRSIDCSFEMHFPFIQG